MVEDFLEIGGGQALLRAQVSLGADVHGIQKAVDSACAPILLMQKTVIDATYAIVLFNEKPTNPSSPVPRNIRLDGSGVGTEPLLMSRDIV
jgi:hypothetical protein